MSEEREAVRDCGFSDTQRWSVHGRVIGNQLWFDILAFESIVIAFFCGSRFSLDL